MIVEIKKNITQSKLDKAQKKIQRNRAKKGFNPDPFTGKIKWEMDGLSIQRMMRNEWL